MDINEDIVYEPEPMQEFFDSMVDLSDEYRKIIDEDFFNLI